MLVFSSARNVIGVALASTSSVSLIVSALAEGLDEVTVKTTDGKKSNSPPTLRSPPLFPAGKIVDPNPSGTFREWPAVSKYRTYQLPLWRIPQSNTTVHYSGPAASPDFEERPAAGIPRRPSGFRGSGLTVSLASSQRPEHSACGRAGGRWHGGCQKG
jgi:hypothetical protein